MRLVAKRVFVFAIEVSVLLFGLVVTVGFAAYFGSCLLLIFGVALTGFSWFAIRAKSSKWKIRQEAARWLLERSRQNLHPNRGKRSRTIRRLLIWLPSVCATLVVIFYPLASHVLYTSALKPYRVAIPWTWTILREFKMYDGVSSVVYTVFDSQGVGRFGLTPFGISHYRCRLPHSEATLAASASAMRVLKRNGVGRMRPNYRRQSFWLAI